MSFKNLKIGTKLAWGFGVIKSNGGIMKSKVSSTSKANIEEVSHDADFENF